MKDSRGHSVQGPQCSGASVFRGLSVQGPQCPGATVVLLVLNTRCVFSVLLCHQGKAGDNGKPGTPGKMVTRLSVCLSVCLSLCLSDCLSVGPTHVIVF